MTNRGYAPVAQLDRVLASGAKGRGFESRLAYQKQVPLSNGQGSLFFMPYYFLHPANLFYCFKALGMVVYSYYTILPGELERK